MNHKSLELFKRGLYLIAQLMLIIFILTGCALLPADREPLPPPLIEPPRIRLNLHAVERGDIVHQALGAGTFITAKEYNLSFLNNSGRLDVIHATIGMQVEEGQILAELETEQIKFDITQMEIDLTKMRLRHDAMKMEHDRLIDSKKDLKQAFETEAGEQNDRELENVLHQIARSEIDLRIHELSLEQHTMHINRAKNRLNAMKIKAPIEGTIVFMERLAVGAWINAYQILFTVADPSELFLRYNPAVLTGFEVGMRVKVDVGGVEHSGTIVMTPYGEPAVDEENPRFEDSIIIKVEELPDGVDPGDSASIRIIFQEKSDVIIIPRAGLRTMGARNYVIVRKNEMNIEVDVEVGVETPTMVEIVTGLEEGDQIILR